MYPAPSPIGDPEKIVATFVTSLDLVVGRYYYYYKVFDFFLFCFVLIDCLFVCLFVCLFNKYLLNFFFSFLLLLLGCQRVRRCR